MSSSVYTSGDFDHFVGAAISAWETALELQPEWDDLDGEERASQTEDWPVYNGIHQRLVDYVAEHMLTESQEAQWDRLNELVAQHTKDLEKMGYRVRVPERRKRQEREVA